MRKRATPPSRRGGGKDSLREPGGGYAEEGAGGPLRQFELRVRTQPEEDPKREAPGQNISIESLPIQFSLNLPFLLKEICPRGNNKVVSYISLYHDKCFLFMLELYWPET